MFEIKRYCLVIGCLTLLALASCRDEWDNADLPGSGTYTIELQKPAPSVVISRAGAGSEAEETVENVAVFVFDAAENLTNGFVEHSADNIRYIDVYLTDSDVSIYAVCNLPSPEKLLENVKNPDPLNGKTNLQTLLESTHTISNPEGAHPGYYVMSGKTTVAEVKGGNLAVPIYRLAAHLDFTISVDTNVETGGDGGDFKMTGVYLCNMPMGSFIFDRANNNFGEAGCDDDYICGDNLSPDEKRARCFASAKLDIKEENGVMAASYDMFENRRGAVPDRSDSWPELSGLENDEKYVFYKQLFKRVRAMDFPNHVNQIPIDKRTSNDKLDKMPQVKESRFYNASYLRIDGVYSISDVESYETSYYVYLGEDNYRDFNVRRNHQYTHDIVIRGYEHYDHRVTGTPLSGLAVFADFSELDAHCNVVKALIYSTDDWTVSVKNPDLTPWLEVSHSAIYKPRIAGNTVTGDEAAFSISGQKGLSYFYVHTDEYIPEINRPGENVTMMQRKERRGTIVCRSNSSVEEYEIVQLPALIAILHIKYEPITMKEVCDTFFVERKLEKKYMQWGFLHYYCDITNTIITQGVWDGLMNTRVLYDVALNGEKDKNGQQKYEPAYPDGLSSDHALGYVISKNRDRNGNGKIDSDEIVWYWPATKELEQIRETKFDGLLRFEGENEIFYSSTPSSHDPYGITPGLAPRLKMEDDSPWLPVRRDRKYNVISCRRKNAWKGPQTGNAGGGVTNNQGWGDGDEVIIDR